MNRKIAAIVTVFAVFVVGVATGRSMTRPAEPRRARPAAHTHPARAQPPLATPGAAVTAAAAALYAFDLPTVLNPRRFEAVVKRIAAPKRERRIRALFGQGIEDVRAMLAQAPHIARAAPLGYRLVRFHDKTASVAIWNVAIGGSTLVTPASQWRTITLDLRYTTDGWKATGGHTRAGPSPASSLSDLARRADSFEAFHHAP